MQPRCGSSPITFFRKHCIFVSQHINPMELINRDVLIIRPKQALINWINTLDSDRSLTLEEYSGHDRAQVYLVPEFDHETEVLSWLEEDFEEWFDDLLNGYSTNEADWPKNRTWKMMNDFFDISYQSLVFDMLDEPIQKDSDE
jgi:hypothetical protein